MSSDYAVVTKLLLVLDGEMTQVAVIALGGVSAWTAGCLYTPDSDGHVVVPEGVTTIADQAFYCPRCRPRSQ